MKYNNAHQRFCILLTNFQNCLGHNTFYASTVYHSYFEPLQQRCKIRMLALTYNNKEWLYRNWLGTSGLSITNLISNLTQKVETYQTFICIRWWNKSKRASISMGSNYFTYNAKGIHALHLVKYIFHFNL